MNKFFVSYYYKNENGETNFANTVLKLGESFDLEELIPEMQRYIMEQNKYLEVTVITYLVIPNNEVN